MEAAHLLPAADVLSRFSVTVESGLRPEQVSGARERYGPNGESAGLAGEARGRTRRSLSLLLYAETGERSSPPPTSPYSPGLRGRAGSESSGNFCRCSWGTRTGCAATFAGGWAGSGFRDLTPGSPSQLPSPRPRDLCGPSALPTYTPDPIHSRKLESTTLRCQRWVVAPHSNLPASSKWIGRDQLARDESGT